MTKSFAAAAFTAALVLSLCSTGRALAAVGNGTLDDLRAKFNEDKAQTRVIALLSPT